MNALLGIFFLEETSYVNNMATSAWSEAKCVIGHTEIDSKNIILLTQ